MPQPEDLTAVGNSAILRAPLLALFCSTRCPGSVALKLHDFAVELRDAGVPVISGFHTPMEKECLAVLLRGKQPIVWCPARSVAGMRALASVRPHIETGRMLVLSPFEKHHHRQTAELAEQRNRFVARIAAVVLCAFAQENGKTEKLCRDLLAAGKPMLTLGMRENEHLLEAGAKAATLASVLSEWKNSKGTT